ncbi:hypothetical protein C2845_PM04G14800 [Panicum miliaceum]|uniref:Uncharacterized protein n=1 Tax=Panicum miliaceum TaxID=4540 RepID=A0A3L6QM51_PANMI|nr:hypothetical protein C2845_PM04G14800 [Panicum miliaceum]
MDRKRANWDPATTRLFLDLCIAEKEKFNFSNQGLTKDSCGLERNKTTGAVEADAEWWETHNGSQDGNEPEDITKAAEPRGAPPPYHDQLDILFGSRQDMGSFMWADGIRRYYLVDSGYDHYLDPHRMTRYWKKEFKHRGPEKLEEHGTKAKPEVTDTAPSPKSTTRSTSRVEKPNTLDNLQWKAEVENVYIDYEKKNFADTFAEFYKVFDHEHDQKALIFVKAETVQWKRLDKLQMVEVLAYFRDQRILVSDIKEKSCECEHSMQLQIPQPSKTIIGESLS